MKRGRSLEKLVAHIEKLLAASPSAVVESPGYLPDKTTGRPREHDVLITVDQAHHRLIIAIECRDRKKRVGVPEVEAFHAKCVATGVNQPIMVSPSGFAKTARTKAKNYGIRCLDLTEAEHFTWLFPPSIAVGTITLEHVSWTLVPSEKGVAGSVQDFSVVDDEGNPVSYEILNRNLMDKLRASAPQQPTAGSFSVKLPFDGKGLNIKDSSLGTIHPLRKLIAKATYKLTLAFSPFRLLTYEESEVAYAEAAVAEVQLGETKGQFVAVQMPDGGKMLSFIPSSPSSGKR